MNLLDLPNEILLLIVEHVAQEDLFAVRQCSKRLYGVASTLLEILYVNHCNFPTDLIETFTENSHIPEKIDFGYTVKYDLNPKHADFLRLFLHTRGLSFEKYPAEIIEFLDCLPALQQLSLPTCFGYWRALDAEAVKAVIDRLKTNNELPLVMENLEIVMCKRKVCTVELLQTIRSNAVNLKSLNLTIKSKEILEQLATINLNLNSIAFKIRENISETVVMEILRKQPNLTNLEVEWSNEGYCTNSLFELLGSTLKDLETLTVRGFRQLIGLQFVNNLQKLVELDLVGDYDAENFDPTHHIADNLMGNPNLVEFSLSYLDGKICTTCWTKITKAFPNLTNLTLEGIKLDKEICRIIFANLKLKELELDECVSDETNFHYSLESQTSLHSLCVTDFPIFDLPETDTLHSMETDSLPIIDVLTENCPELRELTVYVRCPPRILAKITKCFPKLKLLEIHFTSVKAVDWKYFYRCQNLQYLELEDCKIDAGRMKSLFENIPTLVHLLTENFDVKRIDYVEKYEEIWKKTVKKVMGQCL